MEMATAVPQRFTWLDQAASLDVWITDMLCAVELSDLRSLTTHDAYTTYEA